MITIVGAGIAGISCARRLADAGAEVTLVERSSAVGGRLARTSVPGLPRRVEWGAAYLTGYGELVQPFVASWLERGLLRPWTDTFAVAGPQGITGAATGPMRYRAPQGLRSLARDLARGLPIRFGVSVDRVERDTVLAIPRPQAAALSAAVPPQPWEAVTVTVAQFEQRRWPAFEAAFVNGSDELALIVDDGARSGDGAPVLVLYEPGRPSTWPEPAPAASGAGLRAARRILDLPPPVWARTRTWRLAQPAIWDEQRYGYDPASRVGAVGDGWAGKPRIGAAMTSGIAMAEHLLGTG